MCFCPVFRNFTHSQLSSSKSFHPDNKKKSRKYQEWTVSENHKNVSALDWTTFLKIKTFIYDFKVVQWMLVSDLSNLKSFLLLVFHGEDESLLPDSCNVFQVFVDQRFLFSPANFWMTLCLQHFLAYSNFTMMKFAVQLERLSFYLCP